MKREDVKAKISGITEEQLDWLMGEHGRDVTAEKNKLTPLQEQVTTLTGQLQTAQNGLKAFDGVNVDDLKGQITTLQAKMQEQADAFAFDSTLDGAIRDARGRDIKAIRGMLDVETLKASKDRSADVKAALEELAKSKAWAFDAQASETTPPGQPTTPVSTGNPLGGVPKGTIDYDKMSDDEIYAQLAPGNKT